MVVGDRRGSSGVADGHRESSTVVGDRRWSSRIADGRRGSPDAGLAFGPLLSETELQGTGLGGGGLCRAVVGKADLVEGVARRGELAAGDGPDRVDDAGVDWRGDGVLVAARDDLAV